MWEDMNNGCILRDEDKLYDYIIENLDFFDLEEAMGQISPAEIYEHLDYDMKLKIEDLAIANYKENYIEEIEEEE